MKRIIALLTVALLALMPALALAESTFDDLINDLLDDDAGGHPEEPYPNPDDAYDRDDSPYDDGTNAIAIDVGGERVRLVYDPSPQYSSIQGGLVQASYYAYGTDGVTLYELYVIFPETAKAGMVITPQYAAMTDEESSVVLIVSGGGVDRYYCASLMDGKVYPAGSDFSIGIDSVSGDSGKTTYGGRLSAVLIALDTVSGDAVDTLSIAETPFTFTVEGSTAPNATPRPTNEPSDLRKV